MEYRHIKALFLKEAKTELREKYALNGILLYVFSTVLLIQLLIQKFNPLVWITLFWLVVLFASVNAVAKSFIQEGRARMLYLYQISSAENIILSKLLYNSLLLVTVSLLTYLGFSLFFGDVIIGRLYFLLILVLGSLSFAGSFTMVSAIAAKASGSGTLMSILSFPIVVPQLMLICKLSRRAMEGFSISLNYRELISLIAIDVIVFVVCFMLFPYLWRD